MVGGRAQCPVSLWDMKLESNSSQRLRQSRYQGFLILSNFAWFLYFHCVKIIRIRIYSCPYFPAFWPNAERYFIYLRIQSKWEKIRTRITLNTDSVCFIHFAHNCRFFFFKMSLETNRLNLLLSLIQVKTDGSARWWLKQGGNLNTALLQKIVHIALITLMNSLNKGDDGDLLLLQIQLLSLRSKWNFGITTMQYLSFSSYTS